MKSLHLAGPDDIEKLLPMVAALHEETGVPSNDDHRREAVVPLLEGAPHGAIWLIGPRRAPVGYICVSFGWSIEFGGLEGRIIEVFVRHAVRGRGMGTEAVYDIAKALKQGGVNALHLQVAPEDERNRRLFARAHFVERTDELLMTLPL